MILVLIVNHDLFPKCLIGQMVKLKTQNLILYTISIYLSIYLSIYISLSLSLSIYIYIYCPLRAKGSSWL